jgi:hypothetical protein
MTLASPNRLQDDTPVLGAGPASPQAPPGVRFSLRRSARFLAAFAGFALDVFWQMTRSSIRRALKRRPRITRVERDSTPAKTPPNQAEQLVSRPERGIRIEGRASIPD